MIPNPRRRNPGPLHGEDGGGSKVTSRPLSRSQLRGITHAWIAPDGDVYEVPDLAMHDDWAHTFMGCSELALEQKGWAKVVTRYADERADSFVASARHMTAAQREAASAWADENEGLLNLTDNPPRARRLSDRRLQAIYRRIERVLTPDLLTPAYRRSVRRGSHPTKGHCAAAAEALYFLLGGKRAGLVSKVATYTERGQRQTHWWLEDAFGNRFDPTRAQFGRREPPYHLGRSIGFQGMRYRRGRLVPSRRARIILQRMTRLED